MLKDWDFAQFFPNWSEISTAAERDKVADEREKNGTSHSLESTHAGLQRRSECNPAASSAAGSVSNGKSSDPLFSSRLLWAGRKKELSAIEPVLTEFSRKASELELRKVPSPESVIRPLARREKTDLDLRRLELKKELEDRRRCSVRSNATRQRPPLIKSTSEPCAPLTMQQVRKPLLRSETSPLSFGSLLFVFFSHSYGDSHFSVGVDLTHMQKQYSELILVLLSTRLKSDHP